MWCTEKDVRSYCNDLESYEKLDTESNLHSIKSMNFDELILWTKCQRAFPVSLALGNFYILNK